MASVQEEIDRLSTEMFGGADEAFEEEFVASETSIQPQEPMRLTDYISNNFKGINPNDPGQFKEVTKNYLNATTVGLDSITKANDKTAFNILLQNNSIFTYQDLLNYKEKGAEDADPAIIPTLPGDITPGAISDEANLVRDVPKAVARGVIGAAKTPYELLDVTERINRQIFNALVPERFEDTGQTLTSKYLLDPIERSTQRLFPRSADAQLPISEGIKDKNWWAENTVEGLTSIIPAYLSGIGAVKFTAKGRKALSVMADYAAGKVTKAAAKAAKDELGKLAGTGVLLSSTALSTAGQQEEYRAWLEANPDEAETLGAQLSVIGSGMAVGAIESVADKFLLMPLFRRKFGTSAREKASSFFDQFLKTISGKTKRAIVEGGTEQLQQIIGDTLSRLGYDEDKEIFNREKLSDGIIGAAVGFTVPGGNVVTTNEIKQKRSIPPDDPEHDIRYSRQPGNIAQSIENYSREATGLNPVKHEPEKKQIVDKPVFSDIEVESARLADGELRTDEGFSNAFGDFISDKIQLGEFSRVYRDQGAGSAIKWLKKQTGIKLKEEAINLLEEIRKPLRSGYSFEDSDKIGLSGLTNSALINNLSDEDSSFYKGLPSPAVGRLVKVSQEGNNPIKLSAELRKTAEQNPNHELILLSAANQIEQMAKPLTEKGIKHKEQSVGRLIQERNKIEQKINEEKEKVIESGEELEAPEPEIEITVPRPVPDGRSRTPEELLRQFDSSPKDVATDTKEALKKAEERAEEIADDFAMELRSKGNINPEQIEVLRQNRKDAAKAEFLSERGLVPFIATEISDPLNSDSAVIEMQQSLGAENTSRLISSGKLSIVTEPEEMPDNVRSLYVSSEEQIAAVYDKGTDTIYLIPQNINKGDAFNVMAHEISHARHEDIWRSDTGRKVLKTFIERRGSDSRVTAAYGKVPEWTRKEDVDNEALAYYVQNSANATQPLFRRAITEIKRLMVEYLGVSPSILKEADIGAIYSSAVHKFAREEAKAAGNTIFEREDPLPKVINGNDISDLQASTIDGTPDKNTPDVPVGEDMEDPHKLGWFRKRVLRSFKNAGLIEAVAEKEYTRLLNNMEASSTNASQVTDIATSGMEAFYKKPIQKITEKEQSLFLNALKGDEVALNTIAETSPEAIKSIQDVRKPIDRLTESLKVAVENIAGLLGERIRRTEDQNVIKVLTNQLERAERFQQTLEDSSYYLNTSYEAYNNPYYFKRMKEGTELYRQFIKQRTIELSADPKFTGDPGEQAFSDATSILQRIKEGHDLSPFIGSSVIYRSKRNSIAPSIREYLGEVKDVRKIVSQTIQKMQKQHALNLFQTELINRLMPLGMISETVIPGSELYGRNSLNVFSPLNGLYVHENILQGFDDMHVSMPYDGVLGIANAIQSAFRFLKVPLNLMAYPTAHIGNMFYALGSGIMNPKTMVDAIEMKKQYIQDLGQKEFDKFMAVIGIGTTGAQAQEFVQRAEILEGFFSNILKGKLARTAKVAAEKAGLKNVDERYADFSGNAINLFETLVDWPVDQYKSIDPFWKQQAFFYNLIEVQKAKKGKYTEAQMYEKAAEITNKTFQNYSRLPRIIRESRVFTDQKGWRNAKNLVVPFTNTFLSFAGDAGRIAWDSAMLTYSLAKDPDFRPLAMRIGASNAIVAATLAAIAQGAFGGEDDEVLKGTWLKGEIALRSGDYLYDMKYIVPQTMIAKLLVNPMVEVANATWNGDGVDRTAFDIKNIGNSWLQSFNGEFGNDMTASMIVKATKDANKQTAENDTSGWIDNFLSSLSSETKKAVFPQSINHFDKILAGLYGRTRGLLNEYNMPPNVFDELLKLVGIRRYGATYFSAAMGNAYIMRSTINKQNMDWKNIFLERDRLDKDTVDDFLDETQRDWNLMWEDFIDFKNLVVQPGKMTPIKFIEAMNDSAANRSILSKEQVAYLMANSIPPLKLSGRKVLEAEKQKVRQQESQVYDKAQIDNLILNLENGFVRITRPALTSRGILER